LRSYPDVKIDEIGYHSQCNGHDNSTRHENQPSSPLIHKIPSSKSISLSKEGPVRRNRAENIYYPINPSHQNGIPPHPARLLKHKRCIIRNHVDPIQLRESLGTHRNQQSSPIPREHVCITSFAFHPLNQDVPFDLTVFLAGDRGHDVPATM
jgi:hypothetical protein